MSVYVARHRHVSHYYPCVRRLDQISEGQTFTKWAKSYG
jgi:hypothetical protein